MSFLKRIIRTSAFIGKEIAEVRRQPRLVLSLILGPFLILLLFGVGYVGENGNLSALVVIPKAGGYSQNAQDYQKLIGNQIRVTGVISDETTAVARLKDREVDLVIIAPENAAKQIASGAQAQFHVLFNEIDPLRRDFITYLTYTAANEINKQTIAAAAGEGQKSAGDLRSANLRLRNSLALVEQDLDRGDTSAANDQVRAMQSSSITSLAALAIMSQLLRADTPLIRPSAPNTSNPEQVSLERSQTVTSRLNNDLASLNDELESPNPDRQRLRDKVAKVRQDLDDLDQLTQQFQNINPLVLAAPFYGKAENKAPVNVNFTSYYSPGVLVLLLQHIGITLAALSMVRERLLGTVELFQVSPVRPAEILIGKYISFLIFLGVITAVLLALMSNEVVVGGYRLSLGVPILGDYTLLALTLGLVIFASVGLGFFIATVSKSESQAVQLSMLVLLTSVFFSGFFLRTETFTPVIRTVSYALPVTYGITGLQNIMLRGISPGPALLVALLIVGAMFALISFILFNRQFKRG